MTSMDNSFCVACIDDYCVDAVLPTLEAVCEVMNDADITEVFFTDQAHPIVGDPELAASWTTRLSNTSDGSGSGSGSDHVANPIRHFAVVKGKKPAVTPNFKKNQGGTQGKLKPTTRSITFFDDDDSDAKYKMYQAYQCNGNVLMYYRSGKHFYGSDASKTGAGSAVGIKAVIRPSYSIDGDATDGGGHRWSVTIEWDATCEEGRFEAPF